MSTYLAVLLLGVGFGLPLAAMAAAIGQSRAAAAAFEGMARQPELQGKLQMSMIVALAFIESLVIYALLMFFMLFAYLPPTETIIEVLKASGH